jgi:uncharacterized protein YqjF (DUF2071 family)
MKPVEVPFETTHRPWPLPHAPWVLAMQWHDLLFAHWPLPPERLRALIPPPLVLDTFEGMAWLGVVPFMMRGTTLRGIPPMPWLSDFSELNVRTYVTLDDRPGVWFFSLDAANPLAVRAARLGARLPYYDARMHYQRDGEGVNYSSTRTHPLAPPANLVARYRPIGDVYRAATGSLERWLTERYCLYTADRHGHAWRLEIHHLPWSLQQAAAEFERNTMAAPLRLELPERPPLLHFARRLDVVAWMPVPIHG